MDDACDEIDLLTSDALVLARRWNVSLSSIQRREAALLKSLDYAPQGVATFASPLDGFLDLRSKYIYEFSGESASGKSNLLLTLAMHVQPSVYLSTEPFCSKRLLQMSRAAEISIDKVFCVETPDFENMAHVLRYQLPVLIQREKIRLVVIDSITAAFRGQDHSVAKRSIELIEMVSHLRSLFKHDICVIFSNQVIDRFQMTDDIFAMEYQLQYLGSKGKKPALGLVWTNLIDIRVMLEREESFRRMIIKKCPWLDGESKFTITNCGVVLDGTANPSDAKENGQTQSSQ